MLLLKGQNTQQTGIGGWLTLCALILASRC